MKSIGKQKNPQDLLKAFKETTARFQQPSPEMLNLEEGLKDLLCDLNRNLPLVGFSPFDSIEASKEKQPDPLVELLSRASQPVSQGHRSKNPSNQVGKTPASGPSSELNTNAQINSKDIPAKDTETVPVFKVVPPSGCRGGEMEKNVHSGPNGDQLKTRPLSQSIQESAGREKTIKTLKAEKEKPVDSYTHTFSEKINSRIGEGEAERDLRIRKAQPQTSDAASLSSTLEMISRLTDDLLEYPPETDISSPLLQYNDRSAKFDTAEADQTPPVEVSRFTSVVSSESSASVSHRTVSTSRDSNRADLSNTFNAGDQLADTKPETEAMAITRIDILTDRLLADTRKVNRIDRSSVQRFSRSIDDVAGSSPPVVIVSGNRREKQILPEAASVWTENIPVKRFCKWTDTDEASTI